MPCGLPLIESAMAENKPLALHFYNPNIYPFGEYQKRLAETERIAAAYGLELYRGEYDHDEWAAFVGSNLLEAPENYPENSPRCTACFRYRIEKTASFAKENGFMEFATTLSVNRFKDTVFINNYGKFIADKMQLKYKLFELNAIEAHRIGVELSRKHRVYRQKYCGCEFSLPKAV